MAVQTNQRIDGKRLWDSLMDMAQIGATPKGGVKRLTLSDVDRQGRDRFAALCAEAGLTVRVDAIGNMFARRPGRDPSRKPVLVGSHLDSQPSGGKFDGALGVLGGLEVMRSLNDLGITTEAPIELINWTDEEGSRFGHSLMGSGVWAGVYALDQAFALHDLDGVSVKQALDGIGYAGPEAARPFAADAYFELHIEQGRSWSARGARSAWSPGRRRRCGTTPWSPGRIRTPAPPPLRPAATHWWPPPASSIWWTG
jgi:beta-ureidopropionase / N-carbamoyl-L-amino-acid hydrolase